MFEVALAAEVLKMVKKSAKRKHSQIEAAESNAPEPLPAKRLSDEPIPKRVSSGVNRVLRGKTCVFLDKMD